MALIVLDAGVVIALLERQDRHHAAADEAVRAMLRAGTSLVLPASAYAEVMVKPSHTGSASLAVVDEFVDRLPVAILPIDRQVGRLAAAIRAAHRSIRLPDALVLAIAAEIDADRVLTTDRGWPDTGVAVDVIGGT